MADDEKKQIAKTNTTKRNILWNGINGLCV